LPFLPPPHYQNTACLFLFWSSSLLYYHLSHTLSPQTGLDERKISLLPSFLPSSLPPSLLPSLLF
jgi:hypothetical protein